MITNFHNPFTFTTKFAMKSSQIIFGFIALYRAAFSAFCALLSSHMTNKDDDDDDD